MGTVNAAIREILREAFVDFTSGTCRIKDSSPER